MTQMPVMPVLVERLLGDTNHLSNEEMGAYMRLLFNGWLRDAQLEHADLQRLAQAPPRNWPRLWKRLRPFFDEMSPKVYTQRRLQLTLASARKNHAANVSRAEKMRAGLLRKNKGALNNDRRSTKTITETVTERKAAPKTSVTEPMTKTVMDTVEPLQPEPEKKEALPIKSRELLSSAPTADAGSLRPAPNGHVERSAAVASPRLGAGSLPAPSEALLKSKLVTGGKHAEPEGEPDGRGDRDDPVEVPELEPAARREPATVGLFGALEAAIRRGEGKAKED